MGKKWKTNNSSALRNVMPKERDVPFQNASLLGHYLTHTTMHPGCTSISNPIFKLFFCNYEKYGLFKFGDLNFYFFSKFGEFGPFSP